MRAFATPAASVFHYAAPKGATVSTGDPLTEQRHRHGDRAVAPRPSMPTRGAMPARGALTTIGSGWTTGVKLPSGAVGARTGGLLRDATSPYGGGGARLLHTALVNVLIEPDGTAYAGAVTPAHLASVAH